MKYVLKLQAGLSNGGTSFEVEETDDDPKPLRMEHFYFPLSLLLIGVVLSVFFLLAELIIHCRGKCQSEVPMLTKEEPGVSQSSQSKTARFSETEEAEVDI